MGIEFHFDERSAKKVLEEYEKRLPEIMNAMGNELYKSIYNFMTEDKIVDTGRLRGSISYSTPYNDYNQPTPANQKDDFIRGVREDNSVVYGSNVEYASYVETGTTKQRARNYIKSGTDRAVPQLEKAMEAILKGDGK